MLQVHWDNMPSLELVAELLTPWGQVAQLGPNSLRFIPDDDRYPAFYFHAGGRIDILAASADLFYRADCLEVLQTWLAKKSRKLKRSEVNYLRFRKIVEVTE